MTKNRTRPSYRPAKPDIYRYGDFEIRKSASEFDSERWFAWQLNTGRRFSGQGVGGYYPTIGAVVRAIRAYEETQRSLHMLNQYRNTHPPRYEPIPRDLAHNYVVQGLEAEEMLRANFAELELRVMAAGGTVQRHGDEIFVIADVEGRTSDATVRAMLIEQTIRDSKPIFIGHPDQLPPVKLQAKPISLLDIHTAPFQLFHSNDPAAAVHWSFVYLHGTLMSFVAQEGVIRGFAEDAPDLLSASTMWSSRFCGVHDLTIYGLACRAFLWEAGERVRPRGLVVSLDDREALKYAQAKFAKKADFL